MDIPNKLTYITLILNRIRNYVVNNKHHNLRNKISAETIESRCYSTYILLCSLVPKVQDI